MRPVVGACRRKKGEDEKRDSHGGGSIAPEQRSRRAVPDERGISETEPRSWRLRAATVHTSPRSASRKRGLGGPPFVGGFDDHLERRATPAPRFDRH